MFNTYLFILFLVIILLFLFYIKVSQYKQDLSKIKEDFDIYKKNVPYFIDNIKESEKNFKELYNNYEIQQLIFELEQENKELQVKKIKNQNEKPSEFLSEILNIELINKISIENIEHKISLNNFTIILLKEFQTRLNTLNTEKQKIQEKIDAQEIITQKFQKEIKIQKKNTQKLQNKINDLIEILQQKDLLYTNLKNPNKLKRITASLLSDYKFLQYELSSKILENKEKTEIVATKKFSDLVVECKKIEEEKRKLIYEKELLQINIKKRNELYKYLKERTDLSISKITSLYSDFETLHYRISSNILLTKLRPAKKEAYRIQELRKETRFHIERYKKMLYKYEYLLQIFPELEDYVDDFNTIKLLEEAVSIGDIQENYDRVRNYVSKEEYLKLSVDERNQLALDNYIKGKKNNWQIGRDYELFCGLEYEKEGWDVKYYGMEKKLKDLGRDLIARKGNEVEIIQCKYWSKRKTIHEKHILQLYGTTMIESILRADFFTKFRPVFITNIQLSEVAQKFAKTLNVKVVTKQMEEFPRIKCNIGKDEEGNITKIYHLPFDLHYDRTRIKKGEGFYAYTVKEAVEKGFRRAYKYHNIGK